MASRSGAAFDHLFGGEVTPWVYPLLRVSLALVVLARTTDWLAPLVAMDHHGWVVGLDHVESVHAPALHSPLLPGLPPIEAHWMFALGVLRTALACLLLLGVRPRLSAGLLAACGYAMIASDRYHYFHHLHLLWVAVALVALMPSDARLSVLPPRWRQWRDAAPPPRWPLVLVRLQVLIVYASAGLAKLTPTWLSGQLLTFLAHERLVTGPLAQLAETHAAALARAAAATELALVPLLAWPRTRMAGVALALAFHLGIESSMRVSTFGATMLILCAAFLPWEKQPAPDPGPESESESV